MISPNRECSSFPIKIKIDKADVGLENVDNTSDLDKPISNAVRDYLDGAKDSVSTNVALAKEYSDNAKASETNCEAIEAKISALNVATVDTAQNITGAKTFVGETTITGPLGVSGDTALAGKVTVEKELNVDSNGTAEINGKLTATNPANVLQAANHDSVLTSNDVLTAKDINEVNGKGNNLLHRSGNETTTGIKQGIWAGYIIFNGPNLEGNSKWIKLCTLKGVNVQPDYIIITNNLGTYHTNACFFAFAQIGGTNGTRTYSIINSQLWPNNYRVVSLYNLDNAKWELWAMTTQDRFFSHIQIQSLRNGTDVSDTGDVTEYDSLPSNVSNLVYLLGSA